MSLWAPLARRLAQAAGLEVVQKSAKGQAPYASAMRFGGMPTYLKRGSSQLRTFAKNNEWVRTAINRRKHRLGVAQWRIVRIDDPLAKAKPAVVDECRQLFNTVNPLNESLRTLLDKVIEDILVLDAGCVEVEYTAGGGIAGLYALDGASISVDPKWDGRDPNAFRYSQWDKFRKVCDFYNDELIYMMHNPMTDSPIGWSPVETLVRVIEAELYGENYDYQSMRQNAPAGILDLGTGYTEKEVRAFREYYLQEIAGTQDLAITGGGGDATTSSGTKFIPFNFSPREQQRQEYKKWLAVKIAAVFEMDLNSFNLIENVNRANAQTGQLQTDEGLVSLASMVAEYFTREIVWQIDKNHGFEFSDISQRDELRQAQIDKINMSIGVTFPDEVRTRDGKDPVEWGQIPWPVQTSAQLTEPNPDGSPAAPDDGTTAAPKQEAGKDLGPFVAGYRAGLTAQRKSSSPKISAP